jgi:hypothetical protein
MIDSIDAKAIVERFEMQFLMEKRRCIFTDNVPQVLVANHELGPFKKGQEVKLPNWVIEKFSSRGLADIHQDDEYESTIELKKLYQMEKGQPYNLQRFPSFIYTAAGRRLLQLQGDKTSLDPKRYEGIESIQQMMSVMVETRLAKIMDIAKSGGNHDKRKQMAHEEQWLLDRLSYLIDAWREMLKE